MEWIESYEPKNEAEAEDREHLLRLDPSLIATNREAPYHYTTSSMVVDFEADKLLMIYHPIYKSFPGPAATWKKGRISFTRPFVSFTRKRGFSM